MSFPAYEDTKESCFDWLGDVPLHWEFRPLGTCFRERRDKVSDTDYPPLDVVEDYIRTEVDGVDFRVADDIIRITPAAAAARAAA